MTAPEVLLLIDRTAERARLEANLAARRHTLLVGPIGSGKSHLLHVLAQAHPDALVVDQVRPVRVALLALGQGLHARQALCLEGATPTALPWPDCAKRLGRLNVHELTEILVASLRGRGAVLMLDQLEGATPAMGPALERLLEVACLVGATRQLKPGLEKLWWAFDRIDLAPLTREETRQLLWTVADRDRITDPAMFEAKVLSQASPKQEPRKTMVFAERHPWGRGPGPAEGDRTGGRRVDAAGRGQGVSRG